MTKQSLTHDCPVNGRTTLVARWLPKAKQLRATCDDCESAVYANRAGTQTDTTELTV